MSAAKVASTMGERLANARVAAGLTQKQAGDALGLTQSAISEIERGKNETSIANLFRLADLYNIDARFLAIGIWAESRSESPCMQVVTAGRKRAEGLNPKHLRQVQSSFEKLSQSINQLMAARPCDVSAAAQKLARAQLEHGEVLHSLSLVGGQGISA
jgi:DNA-binding XRE family transcriptional regulator